MRCPDCEAKALANLRADLAAHPEAGFVFATARLGAEPGSVSVTAGDVDCCPLALVAVADALLAEAAERAERHADDPVAAQFLAAIATVRETLACAPSAARH